MGRYLDIAKAVKLPENPHKLPPPCAAEHISESASVVVFDSDRECETSELCEKRVADWQAKEPTPRPDRTDKRRPAGGRAIVFQAPEGVPEVWVQGVADLLAMPPHPDWPAARWPTLQGDARAFLEAWGGQAHRLGWDARNLFSVHATAPHARLDGMGLIPLLGGRSVLALTVDQAAIEASRGALTYRRRQHWPPSCCMVWELESENS